MKNFNKNHNLENKPYDLLTADFEINDYSVLIRNLLTKGQIHDEIAQFSGASISTRGRYFSNEEKLQKKLNNLQDKTDRPLYLFIQGNTPKSLKLAVQKIEEKIHIESQKLLKFNHNSSNKVLAMRPQMNEPPIFQPQQISKIISGPPPNVIQQQQISGPLNYVAKITIGLDHAPAAFNLRSRIIGDGGANLHYIRTETNAMATLRGRGSLFIDPALGTESNDLLHLYIEHTTFEGLQEAKQLAKNLIETLQQEFNQFQQSNSKSNIHLVSQPAIIQTPQMGIPPPGSLNVPPPPPPHLIQTTNGIIQQPPPNIMQSQNFLQSQQQPQSQQGPTIIQQQQTIIPNQHLMHHPHQTTVIPQIQHQPTTIGNLNIPPPGIIPIRATTVQLQCPPPMPVQQANHLSQPPPNIQIQAQQPQVVGSTQILLNPQNGQPQYQYQYIQQNSPQLQHNVNATPQQQVTIQHLIQPQQLNQTTAALTQNFEQYQQQQQTNIRTQHLQNGQSILTVQGNAGFMIPPPNIQIHPHQQQPPPPTLHQQPPQNNQEFIFHTQHGMLHHPPPTSSQIQITQHTTTAQDMQTLNGPALIQMTNMNVSQNINSGDDLTQQPPNNKDDKLISPNRDNEQQSPNKMEAGKSEDGNIIAGQNMNMNRGLLPPPTVSISGIPINQPPPPILSMPSHHIFENTIISQPQQQHQQQIYSQIPVSIQSFQQQQQQQQQQQFFLNSQQWQPVVSQQQQPMQHLHPNSNIQNIHFTTRNANEIFISNPPVITNANNGGGDYRNNSMPPHQQQPSLVATMQGPPSMQLQFHQIQQPPPQILQTIQNHQMIEQNQVSLKPLVSTPPPTFNAMENKLNRIENPSMVTPQHYPHPGNNMKNINMMEGRNQHQGHKRKHEDDDGALPNLPPKIGMGSNSGGNMLGIHNQRGNNGGINNTNIMRNNSASATGVTTSNTTTTNTNLTDEPNTDKNNKINGNLSHLPPSATAGTSAMQHQQQQQQSQQHTSGTNDNNSRGGGGNGGGYFQRDNSIDGYHHNNNNSNISNTGGANKLDNLTNQDNQEMTSNNNSNNNNNRNNNYRNNLQFYQSPNQNNNNNRNNNMSNYQMRPQDNNCYNFSSPPRGPPRFRQQW